MLIAAHTFPQTPPTWGQETASVLHTNKLQTKPAAPHAVPHGLWEGRANRGEREREEAAERGREAEGRFPSELCAKLQANM